MCSVLFRVLLEVVEPSSTSIREGSSVAICNGLYNFCGIARHLNLEHDSISSQNMSQFAKDLCVVINVRAKEHLLCSSRQLKTRGYELLVGDVENVMKDENLVECKVRRKETMNGIQKKPMRCILSKLQQYFIKIR